jgi:hypothetical protein
MVDLSGRWDPTDVRLVCESLIKDFLNDPRVVQYIEQYSTRNGGRLPAAIVGAFRNDSSEHIDTGIITTNMESAIVRSGRLDFVAV